MFFPENIMKLKLNREKLEKMSAKELKKFSSDLKLELDKENRILDKEGKEDFS